MKAKDDRGRTPLVLANKNKNYAVAQSLRTFEE